MSKKREVEGLESFKKDVPSEEDVKARKITLEGTTFRNSVVNMIKKFGSKLLTQDEKLDPPGYWQKYLKKSISLNHVDSELGFFHGYGSPVAQESRCAKVEN
jgi:hypothetical protein